MTRHNQLAAALLGAGLTALAGNAFVNPTPPRTTPDQLTYSSYTATRGAATESEYAPEEQTSLTGLFAGVMLGLVVGLAGGMGPASAGSIPGKDISKSIWKESWAEHSSPDVEPNTFDANVNSLLFKKLEGRDIDTVTMNPEGIGDKYPIDESQIPRTEYRRASQNGMDPDLVNAVNGQALPAVATPAATPAKVEEKPVFSTPVKTEPVKQEEKKSNNPFSFFKKK